MGNDLFYGPGSGIGSYVCKHGNSGFGCALCHREMNEALQKAVPVIGVVAKPEGYDLDEDERFICAEALRSKAEGMMCRFSATATRDEKREHYAQVAKLLARAAELTRAS